MTSPAAKNSVNQAPLMRAENINWILASQAFAIVPLLLHLPSWLWGLWALAIAWRALISLGSVQEPGMLGKILLAVGCIGGLYLSFPSRTGLEPMIGLLVCSFILKLVELKTRKDGLLLIFIGFIAVAAQFLFNQDLLTGFYGALCCAVLLTAWQTIYHAKPHGTAAKIGKGALLLCHSLPLMLILFVVMPRLGPLWTVPVSEARGKTGFSDSMSPGDLGSLVQNGEPAFRATFAGLLPPGKSLYWRGLILNEYDGRTWRAHDGGLPSTSEPAPQQLDDLIDYAVIVEPHQQPWLFSLPRAVKVDASAAKVKVRGDGMVEALAPVFSRLQYKVTSAQKISYVERQGLGASAIRVNTQLPADGDPQARHMAYQWRLAGLDSRQKVVQALQLFNASFTYTLQPPVLGDNPVDEFLFGARRGFCEHFASSFAFLMRAAGVPARVVVGYQGGRYNEVENYILVSQSDAHAWVEVWHDGLGWTTVDPTGAVAPNRIEEGLDQALTEDDRALVGQGAWQGSSAWMAWQKRWDAAGYAWQRWVLNYDTEKQQNLFTRLLGSTELWRLGIALLVAAGALAAVFIWWLTRNRRPRVLSAQARMLAPFLKRMARQGLQPIAGETFNQFLLRVGASNTRYRIPAQQLASLFERAVYQGQQQLLPALARHLKLFPTLPADSGKIMSSTKKAL